MNKENLTVFDDFSNNVYLLKGFAGLSIALLHWFITILPMYIPVSLNVLMVFILELGGLGVEIFVFLSGMLLAINMVKVESGQHSWKNWYKRRIVRLYPNFILISLINFFFISFFSFLPYSNTPNYFVKRDANDLFVNLSGFQSIPIKNNFGVILTHYWFLFLILSCYMMFPIFYFIIKKWFKLMIIISIAFFCCYVIFFEPIFKGSDYILNSLFNHNFAISEFRRFPARYFDFFFGVLFGYWIGQDGMRNLRKLQNNTLIKVLILISLIGVFMLHLYVLSFLGNFGNFRGYTEMSNTTRNLSFPLIGMLFSVFILITLVNRSNITKKFTLPGKVSYEIYLIHNIPLTINSYIFNWSAEGNSMLSNETKFNYGYLSIPLIFISTLLLAYPFYRFGEWVKKKKELHLFVLIISVSLIIYGFSATILFLFHFTQFNNMFSIVLFIIILLSIGIFFCWRNIKTRREVFTNQTNAIK
ncbi:MAG: acyltransferase family protein [Candidatus Thorarchaeota archaeon]